MCTRITSDAACTCGRVYARAACPTAYTPQPHAPTLTLAYHPPPPQYPQYRCAKDDDPLTVSQPYRQIHVQVSGNGTSIHGAIRFKFLQFVTEINVDAASVTDGNCRAALLRLPNVRDADCTAVSYGGNGGAGGCAHVRRSMAVSIRCDLQFTATLAPHPSPLPFVRVQHDIQSMATPTDGKQPSPPQWQPTTLCFHM